MDPKLKTPETSSKPTILNQFTPQSHFFPNFSLHPNPEIKPTNPFDPNPNPNPNPNSNMNTQQTPNLEWDPHAMLTNLSFLEQKIQQVKSLVQSTITQQSQFSNRTNDMATRQQLINADLTCIIIQLISTAGSLLPSIKNSILNNNPSLRQLITPELNNISKYEGLITNFPESSRNNSEFEDLLRNLDQQDDWLNNQNPNPNPNINPNINPNPINDLKENENLDDHDLKESDDGDLERESENLPPGSYIVLQLEKEEILAPHTHFCNICGKGFKRDANLRMHMRGHGDEYKTNAALSKPNRETGHDPLPITRYSCPFIGCKRNKEHKKFQPLKTILCVKNHYKRSHCDKSYTCSRCNTKKFSVIADLKTHEKHCGKDKWLCSCGTTFSRKDKLFGHVALFQGHTPALQMEESKGYNGNLGEGEGCSGNFAEEGLMEIKGIEGGYNGNFSPMNFEGFGGIEEFDLGENSYF